MGFTLVPSAMVHQCGIGKSQKNIIVFSEYCTLHSIHQQTSLTRLDHPHHYEYWIKIDIHLCMAICNLQTVLLLPPGVCTGVMVRSVRSSKYRWQNIIIITVPPSSHGARRGMTLQLLSRTVSVFWMFCDHSYPSVCNTEHWTKGEYNTPPNVQKLS